MVLMLMTHIQRLAANARIIPYSEFRVEILCMYCPEAVEAYGRHFNGDEDRESSIRDTCREAFEVGWRARNGQPICPECRKRTSTEGIPTSTNSSAEVRSWPNWNIPERDSEDGRNEASVVRESDRPSEDALNQAVARWQSYFAPIPGWEQATVDPSTTTATVSESSRS